MQSTTTSAAGIPNLDPGASPWEQRLNALLNAGVRAGADLVEVFLERTDHLGVLAEQDKITSVSPAFGMGAGIRVFRGTRDGFVSTNDLSDAGLAEALDQALAMLQLERSTLSGSTAFQGLGALKNFAAQKNDWLDRTPDLSVITQRLLEGTQCLQRLGQHLEVLTKTLQTLRAFKQSLGDHRKIGCAIQPIVFLRSKIFQSAQTLEGSGAGQG